MKLKIKRPGPGTVGPRDAVEGPDPKTLSPRRMMRYGVFLFYRDFRNLRCLQLVLSTLLILVFPLCAEPFDLPPLSMRVNDFAAMLNPSYQADLNRRLAVFDRETGYAIHIALMPGNYNQSLTDIARELFESNELEKSWSAGTVLLLIAAQNGRVGIATSASLLRKVSGSKNENVIQDILQQHKGRPEVAIEYVLHAVLELIDPWFYVLEPSAYLGAGALFVRLPTAEIILLLSAPLLGLMTGIVIMAFTSAGGLPGGRRLLVSGCLGCLVVAATAFLIRQPGGILPGMIYFSAGIGFVVSGAVGALRPFWINDAFKGRKSGEPGPLNFHWG